MIEYLNGLHETPNYQQNAHFCIYKNDLAEDYPDHWHVPMEVIMPVENTYTAIIGEDVFRVKPYEVLFIGPNVIHALEAPNSGVRYIVQIDSSRLRDISGVNSILSFMGQAALFTPENAPAIHHSLMKLFQEMCEEYFQMEDATLSREERHANNVAMSQNNLCEPIVYAKFLTMLTLIGRNHIGNVETETTSQTRRQEYIGKFMSICNYIDEHFAEDLTLEDIADMANFSKFHFSRLFKQFTGASFYKYVNQKRIAHAEELLISPDISVTQVAISSGFSSPSAFIRMFKQIKGCTPTEFRKIWEENAFVIGQMKEGVVAAQD